MGSNEGPDGTAAAREQLRDNAALGRFELWRDNVATRGGTVTAICPFVVDFVARHAEYADLIDPRHPGYRDRADAEAARTARGG